MQYTNFFISSWELILNWAQAHGLKVIIILAIWLILHYITRPIIKKIVTRAVTRDDKLTAEEEEKRETTLIRIFVGTIKIVVGIVFFLMILSELGIDVGPLIAGAGIVGIAVGFGAQYIVRDIITGFFIILENQYRVGDSVTLAGIGGSVEDITLRVTVLRDLDGTVHHIPHGEIKTVSNRAKGFARVNINVGVDYDSDLEKVIKVVNEVGEELANDQEYKDSIIEAPKFIRVDQFADSAIIIKIVGEVMPLKQWEVAGEVRKRLKIAFDKNGIVIPFPQVVMRQK
jgi:small-conductance mechanosensitive channel